MKLKGKHVILSFVCLVLGFLTSFSYQLAKEERAEITLTDSQWNRNYQLRNQINEKEKINNQLQQELIQKQEKVMEIEKELANEENTYSKLAKEVEKLRMFLGKVKVKGSGIVVTLDDADFNADVENLNDYIVHEQHVFKLINELFISGASAISINGHRITKNSYIVCNGPVITVDGNQSAAPFVIRAIGDAEVLESALYMNGGVRDQLVSDNVVFTLEKVDEIVMEPILGSGS
jgi:uncharacterized protein YlxW (UPF0749 family)